MSETRMLDLAVVRRSARVVSSGATTTGDPATGKRTQAKAKSRRLPVSPKTTCTPVGDKPKTITNKRGGTR